MQANVIRAAAAAMIFAVGGFMTAAVRAAPPPPESVVQTIADELSSQVENHRDELRNDRDKLLAVIDSIFLPHFDIDYASILVLGKHARDATPEQRQRFAAAFYKSIAHRYAEGLLNYTKGSVKVLPFTGELDRKRSIVRTQVVLNDGKTIAVNYAFRLTRDDDWKAYDVIIEGISYVTNYRNQVDAEVRKSGLEELIDRLETRGSEALEAMDPEAAG